MQGPDPSSTVAIMTADEFVPVGFTPPTSLTTGQFRLEPLGPHHNQAERVAAMEAAGHLSAEDAAKMRAKILGT